MLRRTVDLDLVHGNVHGRTTRSTELGAMAFVHQRIIWEGLLTYPARSVAQGPETWRRIFLTGPRPTFPTQRPPPCLVVRHRGNPTERGATEYAPTQTKDTTNRLARPVSPSHSLWARSVRPSIADRHPTSSIGLCICCSPRPSRDLQTTYALPGHQPEVQPDVPGIDAPLQALQPVATVE